MGGASLVSLHGPHPAGCQFGEGSSGTIARVGGELGEPLERFGGATDVVACEPDLHEQLQRRCATGIGYGLAAEAKAGEVLRQRDLAACERDRGQRPPGNGVRLVALEQAARLIEPALPNPKVRELDQRRSPHQAVAPLERADRPDELLLRLVPTPDRDQDPAVMTPTDGRHEVAPRLEAPGYAHPLLGARDIERDLAGAQQPAVDVTHWDDADDLAGRDCGHRLVDELHALRHTPRGTNASPRRASASYSRSTSPNRRPMASAAAASRSRSAASSVNGARSRASQPCPAHSLALPSRVSARAIQPLAAAMF